MTKPKHADAVPSVRFIHGRPRLTDDERLEAVEERADGTITDLRGLALMLQKDIGERKAFERTIRERTHKHADALLVLTADVATLTKRIDAQEDLHVQRHRLVLDELRALRSDLALTRSKANHAADDAREARASRPDDGHYDRIAARALEGVADAQALENERKRESIRARTEKRAAFIRWGSQALFWATTGGGIALLITFC